MTEVNENATMPGFILDIFMSISGRDLKIVYEDKIKTDIIWVQIIGL